jgi:hypothetical protein
VADTDGDGLKDGEEVCRLDANKNRIGGWAVPRSANYWVCSNPLDPDNDRDGLYDSQEKTFGLSPWAPNTAVLLDLVPQPQVSHDGSIFTLVTPGASLSGQLSLVNASTEPVSGTMKLCVPGSVFNTPSVTSVTATAGYTPPAWTSGTDGSDKCDFWNFAGSPLHSGEAISATFSATLLTSVTASQNTTAKLSVPYYDPVDKALKTLSRTANVVIDAGNPVTIAAPATRQPSGSVCHGGSASDAGSWSMVSVG